MLVLHGTAPYPDEYAKMVRDDWASIAQAGHFIVAAPTAHDTYVEPSCNCTGVSWLVPPSSSATDYDEFDAIRTDLEAAYNIERTRIYGWGFSAGAHVMHDLGVNAFSAAFNASTMAAYGVSAGALASLACGGLTTAQCGQVLAALPRKIPVDIHLGNTDPLYTNVKYHAGDDPVLFENNGWYVNHDFFYTLFSGGHTYTVAQLGNIWSNLCPNAVIP